MFGSGVPFDVLLFAVAELISLGWVVHQIEVSRALLRNGIDVQLNVNSDSVCCELRKICMDLNSLCICSLKY